MPKCEEGLYFYLVVGDVSIDGFNLMYSLMYLFNFYVDADVFVLE